jgi:hypothetical protein
VIRTSRTTGCTKPSDFNWAPAHSGRAMTQAAPKQWLQRRRCQPLSCQRSTRLGCPEPVGQGSGASRGRCGKTRRAVTSSEAGGSPDWLMLVVARGPQ